MTIDLRDQRALVVGGTGGIGGAVARAFADAGASLTVAGRSPAAIEAAALSMGARPALLDILDAHAIEEFFVQEPPFDYVVIAAASTKTGPVATLPLADAEAAMDSKFWGAYRIARSARVNDGGSLTFISGFLSTRPAASAVLQGAINAALEALGRGLALERAPIRVNTVAPGVIDTPLWRGMPEAARQSFLADTATALPARRIGQPENVAQAVLFVAANPFVTGTTIFVDGGGTIA